MKMPDDYIKYLGYNSIQQWIDELYLSSMIDAYKIVKNDVPNISGLDENGIRNKIQHALTYKCGKISNLIQDRQIEFIAEGQIITKEGEIKRNDIRFFIGGLLYIVECKKIKGAVQAQYIDAGIKRFVYLEYINDTEDYAGMCSFVFGGNLEGIIDRLKKNVSDYHFVSEKTSLLSQKVCNWEASFQSQHSKQNSDKEILIHHLFFDFR